MHYQSHECNHRPNNRSAHGILSPDHEWVNKAIWETACLNEFGRLMNGLKRGIKGTKTMYFINANQVSKGRKVTYARFFAIADLKN